MRFSGKVAVVTGGSRGVGRAIVERLAREGADIAFIYRRDVQAAEALEAVLRGQGRQCLALRAEMSDLAAVRAALAAARDRYGHIDILVANAASTAFKPLLEASEKHLDLTYAITVKGFVAAVQEVVPVMPAGGRIVAISGVDSYRYIPRHGILGSAKAAMEALVRYLAHELGERGITVNCINPGYIDSDGSHFYWGGPESHAVMEEGIRDATPLRVIGEPREIAGLAAYLCSEEAAWIQGQTIFIDGGALQATPGHGLRFEIARGWREAK